MTPGDLVSTVRRNPIAATILDRAPELGLPHWYLTAGGVFQTVWNVVSGRDPRAGILDYDLFYFDASDLSYDAEDAVIRRAAELFAGLDAEVEVRNEARVHLWYEEKFGVTARPFTSTEDAIDHFPSTTGCVGISADGNDYRVYAPHGLADLAGMVVRPNPVLAPREVYLAKTARWRAEWPQLVVEPWPVTGS